MPYLKVDDRQIYFEHHAGAKLPVLLIHGWGASVRVWDTTLPALLDAGHAVIAFDQRGCGDSDKDFATVSIEAAARDAVALLRHLGVARVALNGWSLGGAISVAAAVELGSACAGIVLTTAASPRYVQAPDFPHGPPAGTATQTVGLLRADRATFLDMLSKGCCAKSPSPAVDAWLWSIFMRTSPKADATLAELDVIDQRATLAALDAPVLSIYGGKDTIVAPDIGRSVANYAKRTTLVEFPDCGHAPFLEDGPRYRAVLLDFLGRLG